LAREVDPSARYLGGTRFDAALLTLYGRLWRTQPVEMASVYARKLAVSGPSMMDWSRVRLSGRRLGQTLLFPLRSITNGAVLVLVFAAAAVAGAREAWRDDSPALAIVSIVAVVGLLAQLEMALLVSVFFLQYHAVAFFALVFVCSSAYAVAIDRLLIA